MPPADGRPEPAGDAYAPYCLHGTLPLVRDEREASGYRFAQIGQDPPDVCIRHPSDLPAGELTLRSFRSLGEAEGYAAALAEHGGNAFTSLLSPQRVGVDPFLLVIRHDREREPVATLEEAVQLIGPGRPSPVDWSRARAASAATMESTRRQRALLSRWRAEESLVRSLGDAYVTELTDAGVEFMSTGTSARFVLGGHPEASVLSWNRIANRLEPDLARLAEEEIAASGAEAVGTGSYLVRLRELSKEELVRAIATERALAIAAERLSDLSGNRTRLSEIAADPAAARVLARAAAGLPVLSTDSAAPAAQISPKSGTPQTVPATLLGRLIRHGLMIAAWAPGATTRQDPETWCPRLYVPTEAGRLVASGRTVEAAGLVGNLRFPRPEPNAIHAASLFRALASMSADMPDDVRLRLGQAVEEHLPGDCENLAHAAGYGRNYSSWSPLVHGALAGVLTLDDTGRLRRGTLPATVSAPLP